MEGAAHNIFGGIKGMGKSRIAIAAMVLSAALFTAGLASAEPSGTKKAPAKKTTAKAKTETKTEVKKTETAAASQGGSRYDAAAREAVLKEVKQKYVCISNNMYLADSEATGALCADGARVIDYVNRMLDSGWMKSDILGLIDMLKMGRPLVQNNGQTACAPPDGNVQLDFFIMSYCPYGVKFVSDTLSPMLDAIGSDVNFTPYYIVGEGQDGKLSSLHGQKELDEDLRQVCVREKFGNIAWKEYFKCFMTDIYGNREAPKDWTYCAEKAKVDKTVIQACFDTEATKLIQKDMALSDKYGAQASPTAVYNCKNNIVGAIPFAQIKGEVCRLAADPKPAACKPN